MSASSRQALRLWRQVPTWPRGSPSSSVPKCLNALGHVSRYSTEAPPPPLLAVLKGDLKGAMKAKDATRLAVLRSVLSATLNASKTATPINSDVRLVALLRKTARASHDAILEFRAADREDLVEKEQAQIKIIEEYAARSGIEDVGGDELRTIIRAAVGELVPEQRKIGNAMKAVLAPGGPLDGKNFDKAEVANIIKEEVGTRP